MAVRPQKISRVLLLKILHAFSAQLNAEAQGLIPGISRGNILEKRIALPVESEQPEVELRFQALAEAQTSLSKHIAEQRNLRSCLINEVFTKGEV